MQSRIPLAIVHRSRLLLAHRNRGRTKLPEIHLSKERSGLALCQAIRDQLGFEVFLLRVPSSSAKSIPVMRLQKDPTGLPSGYAWVSPHDIDCGPLPEPDRVALLDPADTAFGQYAWLSLAEDWLQDAVARLGHTIRFLEHGTAPPAMLSSASRPKVLAFGSRLSANQTGESFWRCRRSRNNFPRADRVS